MDTDASVATETPAAYEEFLETVTRYKNLGYARGVLSWDQEVMMPEAGTPARSRQTAALSAVSHELLTSDELGEQLDALADADLTDEQAAVVREVSRERERATSVPTELVEEISQKTSEAHPTWKEARAEDDFSTFAPALAELVELKREYANHIAPEKDPYETLFEEYEPYLGLETAERVLDRLKEELPPLVDAVRDSDADLAVDSFDDTYDTDDQMAFVRAVLDELGYDWDRGRLDEAPHPFSSGTQYDARVTTRFDEEDPLGATYSTVHEFGHASYTQGLPDEHYGTPLGEARDLTVHESQSRLWENHVGRSKAFWQYFLPELKAHFDGLDDVTVEDAYEAANQVYEDNLIRVEADELTYHMHVVVRFEIERDLISGDLDVEDVPEAWNDKYEQYLGIRPETDAEGCLQDIHWSHGSFGYFSTYSLGSVLAAQLYAAAEDDLDDLDAKLREGEFDPLMEWLNEHVHRHGKRYETDDLVEHATGEPYTADYFLDYVTEKYEDLYDLA
ncbi:carboxypeptidase M32 [Halorubellus sp. JP-L1]|uniref:carboxypeptidase M32 n=1 Tax=Halorubellus sp. JP-L1 TaxID=2715753 RepID=UPI0014097902|nr:carboxypeptidase M32 [Halorubellus sp. JP-L1]NHN42432.1 carboxypeptidase M32 [Halorubellus sp. JP-L1]